MTRLDMIKRDAQAYANRTGRSCAVLNYNRAEMPGNVTLFAVPDRTTGLFGERAARGTKWRAGASRWEDSPSGVGGTSSRFGRDVYAETCADAKAAKVLAEAVYREAILEWWRY